MLNPYQHHNVDKHSQAHILIEIECLTNDILSGNPQQLAICSTHGISLHFWNQFYMIILGSLGRYLSVYSQAHVYTEQIAAFWAGCQAAGLLPQKDHYGVVRHHIVKPTFAQVQTLVTTVVEFSRSERLFKRHARDRFDQMKNKNVTQSEDALNALKQYARSLVIAMHFGIDKKFQHLVGIDRFYDYVDVLNRELDRNQLFKGRLFISKGIEQGAIKGYHLHLGIVFNGHERRNDEYIALQIGELWLRITQGMGAFRSSNTKQIKGWYERLGLLGVGMIDRDDEIARENALRVLCYTTKINKTDQYLRMRPAGRRAFAKGTSHRVKSSK